MSDDQIAELHRDAEALARRFLLGAGFNFAAPEPRTVWQAFKEFATAPLAQPQTITIGYEAYQASDRDRVLWLSFVRSVEAGNGVGWHVGYVLSRDAPLSLVGADDRSWWWPEDSSLQAWFAGVEGRTVFRECMALDGWKWEGFSD
jgi:hypothetical protein